VNLGLRNREGPFQKVEIAPLVGLGDMLRVEAPETAWIKGFPGRPLGPAAVQLLVGDPERQPAAGDVELDDVAVADERQRAADE
jgi:hypothetical protein